MRILHFSDTDDDLQAVIAQVADDADVAVILRCDAPDAVLMSFDYYSSLMETVHLLSSPANAAHLAASLAQARNGKFHTRRLTDVPDTAA